MLGSIHFVGEFRPLFLFEQVAIRAKRRREEVRRAAGRQQRNGTPLRRALTLADSLAAVDVTIVRAAVVTALARELALGDE